MNEHQHQVIQESLKKGGYVASQDQLVFTKYMFRKITLQECKQSFFKNNDVIYYHQVQITDELFKEWLKSIWYVQRGRDEQEADRVI